VGRNSVLASRITKKHQFPAESDGGKIRIIVCSEEHVRSATGQYYIPSGVKTYEFENGEPAAKLEDAFLDRTGEIYRALTQ
jgi:hypothetical protein